MDGSIEQTFSLSMNIFYTVAWVRRTLKANRNAEGIFELFYLCVFHTTLCDGFRVLIYDALVLWQLDMWVQFDITYAFWAYLYFYSFILTFGTASKNCSQIVTVSDNLVFVVPRLRWPNWGLVRFWLFLISTVNVAKSLALCNRYVSAKTYTDNSYWWSLCVIASQFRPRFDRIDNM